MSKSPLERAIDAAGSQSAFARSIRTSQQRVSYWLDKRLPIPGDFVFAAEKISGISRHEFRPDLFDASGEAIVDAPIPPQTATPNVSHGDPELQTRGAA